MMLSLVLGALSFHSTPSFAQTLDVIIRGGLSVDG